MRDVLIQGAWSPEFAQAIVDALTAHVAVLDDTGRIVAVNRAWRDFGAANGLDREDGYLGASYLEYCERATGEDEPFGRAAAQGIREVIADRCASFRLEYPCHSHGEQRWFMLYVTAFELGSGRSVVLAHENVTARKLAELEGERLSAELKHRVKNILAVTQAVATQTLQRSRSLESFSETFGARLAALARTHDLLTEDWRSIGLRTLLEAALDPYRSRHSVAIAGPDLQLPANVGFTLGIVLHELATNAAKYGALSTPAGRIEIQHGLEWRGESSRLVLDWRERGGPTVRPPQRRGFGTTMIERSVTYDLDGDARIDFAPTGLHCRVEVPLPAGGARPAPNLVRL